jgi:predicted nuclease of predicted toxin-antitoxin system
MKLLIDESLNFRLLNACQSAGISFICVKDIMRGALDTEIIQFSNDNERIILTEDKDFGELVFKQNLKPYGVIFLRYSPLETADASIALFKCLTEHQTELQGNFIAITPRNTRIISL